ncbi:MAG: adenylate/guanylate cyclase domain-containing protein, partial [Hyphomicrobiales bacterium]|nr:adenylate/guanylate cyclase domain-containing protein [Hyphomicrobiales bacterium]
YTIIGAEANLAARLESIAEPGGIVLSYETYALVQDHVEAEPLDPISLKGISREIVPYAVQNILRDADHGDGKVIESRSDRLRLYLDLASIDAAERKSIEATLADALDAVRKGRDGDVS